MICINVNGQIVIQTTKITSDYPFLVNSLLDVCKETVSHVCFDKPMANAVINVLNLVSEMLPNEEQSKIFLEHNTIMPNFSTDLEEIKDALS